MTGFRKSASTRFAIVLAFGCAAMSGVVAMFLVTLAMMALGVDHGTINAWAMSIGAAVICFEFGVYIGRETRD